MLHCCLFLFLFFLLSSFSLTSVQGAGKIVPAALDFHDFHSSVSEAIRLFPSIPTKDPHWLVWVVCPPG